jgi:hypothetical protein
MRCPSPHASLICLCVGEPEVLGNVRKDGPGSDAARERFRCVADPRPTGLLAILNDLLPK